MGWLKNNRVNNNRGDKFNVRAFLRVKYRCQLIVKLKTIE